MRRSIFLLALLPSLAFGQVLRRDTGVGTFSTSITAPGMVSTGTIQTKGLVSTALETPVNATFTAGTGVLPNATYYARIAACNAAGCTVPSTETSLAITTGGINYNWGAVTGATTYKVYCRTTGAEQLCATVTAPTTTWLDDGSVTPSGAIPALGTSGNILTTSGVTARDVTTTAASGSTAFQLITGSKLWLGTGGVGGLYYDGSYVRVDGTMSAPALRISTITTNGLTYFNGEHLNLTFTSDDASDGTAVAFDFDAHTALTTNGDLLLRLKNATVSKFEISKDGMLRFGIGNTGAAPTCDATQRGKLWIVNGGAGVTDTVTLCLKAAADTYSWVVITTGG